MKAQSQIVIKGLSITGLLITLLVGIHLGGLQHRFRRDYWRMQGLLAGVLIGYVLARVSSGGNSSDS